jgi:hypothetical protein
MFILVDLSEPSTVLLMILFSLHPTVLGRMSRPSTIGTIESRSYTLIVFQ